MRPVVPRWSGFTVLAPVITWSLMPSFGLIRDRGGTEQPGHVGFVVAEQCAGDDH
jgi:hypothetical protein